MFLWRSFVRELRNLQGCIDKSPKFKDFFVLLFIAFVSLSCNIIRRDFSRGLGMCGDLGTVPGCLGPSPEVKCITLFASSNVIDCLGPLVACMECV